MDKRTSRRLDFKPLSCELSQNFPVLSRRVLRCAYRDVSRFGFMKDSASLLLDFSGCEAIELRTRQGDNYYRCGFGILPKASTKIEIISAAQREAMLADSKISDYEWLCGYIYSGQFDPSQYFFTRNGSYWTGDVSIPQKINLGDDRVREISLDGDYKTLAIIPFVIDEGNFGLMIMKKLERYYFTRQDIEFYEGVAQTFGVAASCRRSQYALRERLKELTCIYEISRIVEKPDTSTDEILQGIVRILPSAMQHSELASARIVLHGREYVAEGFKESEFRLASDIAIKDEKIGMVEVFYSAEGLDEGEGLFLSEERSLLDAVAKEIGSIVETRRADEQQALLQEQLRHADRLATVGQFAAGIAHELNDPLSRILGFAQLASKADNLSQQVDEDLDRIINASLNARNIVKKLLIFTRDVPQTIGDLDLNRVVAEEILFFESQCGRKGIELVKDLAPNLPLISADPVQIKQVLVNLAVNAIHAMPNGGRLRMCTRRARKRVALVVEDNGEGMSEEVRKKIFIPFFTTKDVGKGTGLGMSVVHGIVMSHGGKISVDSAPGEGTRVEVEFPQSHPKEAQ